MILNFRNGNNPPKEMEREIGKPTTYKEAWDIINNFLDAHNFKNNLDVSVWIEDGRYWFDVGSHSEFFILDTCGVELEELKGL